MPKRAHNSITDLQMHGEAGFIIHAYLSRFASASDVMSCGFDEALSEYEFDCYILAFDRNGYILN